MNRYLQIDPRARKDVRGILTWLTSRSPRGAATWFEAFWATGTRITVNAESFAMADEAEKLTRAVRQAIFKTRRGRPYRVIFDFSDTEVFILRVRRPGQRSLRQRDLPAQ